MTVDQAERLIWLCHAIAIAADIIAVFFLSKMNALQHNEAGIVSKVDLERTVYIGKIVGLKEEYNCANTIRYLVFFVSKNGTPFIVYIF